MKRRRACCYYLYIKGKGASWMDLSGRIFQVPFFFLCSPRLSTPFFALHPLESMSEGEDSVLDYTWPWKGLNFKLRWIMKCKEGVRECFGEKLWNERGKVNGGGEIANFVL